MSVRLEYLAAKRERLVARSAAQRAALAHDVQPLRAPLAVADRGVALVRTASRYPLLVAGVAALLVVWRPRRAVHWLQYGWMGWQVARRLRSSWSQNNAAP